MVAERQCTRISPWLRVAVFCDGIDPYEQTVIGDYVHVNTSFRPEAESIFANTYAAAQMLTLQYEKIMPSLGPETISNLTTGSPGLQPSDDSLRLPSTTLNGFLNDYHDDEGWWALAWIKAYDLTQDTRYLTIAQSIFQDMTYGWNNGSCGGLWWDRTHTAINAIENELFISLAAHLANRVNGEGKRTYVDWAEHAWAWFQASGMMNVRYSINDGIDNDTCQNNLGQAWSYNQGVILGGLIELSKLNSDASYLDTATKIANAAINRLGDANSVIREPCEPACGADGPQFKGIFMRNLQTLQQAAPSLLFAETISANADSIWANDRDSNNNLGLIWAGPYQEGTASEQSSACDALIAAAALDADANATV